MRELTDNQIWVLEELRKRGGEFIAEVTKQHWEKGESYYLDGRINARGIKRKFEQGNKEATGI